MIYGEDYTIENGQLIGANLDVMGVAETSLNKVVPLFRGMAATDMNRQHAGNLVTQALQAVGFQVIATATIDGSQISFTYEAINENSDL